MIFIFSHYSWFTVFYKLSTVQQGDPTLLFTYPSICQCFEKKRQVFHIFTFKMGAIKTDRPVRINTRVPVTLCSLKPNQKITILPLIFIGMLLFFSPSKKTIHWLNQSLAKTAKVWVSHVINTSRTAQKLNRTIKNSLKTIIGCDLNSSRKKKDSSKSFVLLNSREKKKSLALGPSITGLFEALIF